jgi:hypothetical protein
MKLKALYSSSLTKRLNKLNFDPGKRFQLCMIFEVKAMKLKWGWGGGSNSTLLQPNTSQILDEAEMACKEQKFWHERPLSLVAK